MNLRKGLVLDPNILVRVVLERRVAELLEVGTSLAANTEMKSSAWDFQAK
jgi:hypothetical protein